MQTLPHEKLETMCDIVYLCLAYYRKRKKKCLFSKKVKRNEKERMV
jgi:hypothetical protein